KMKLSNPPVSFLIHINVACLTIKHLISPDVAVIPSLAVASYSHRRQMYLSIHVFLSLPFLSVFSVFFRLKWPSVHRQLARLVPRPVVHWENERKKRNRQRHKLEAVPALGNNRSRRFYLVHLFQMATLLPNDSVAPPLSRS